MKQIVLNIKQVVGFCGVGLACLNVLFALLALALDTWIVQCSRGNFGLWKACTNTKCETLSTVSGTINAARALVVVGVFATICAAVTAGLRVFKMKNKQNIFFATVGLSVAAGLCLLSGFAIFAYETRLALQLEGINYGAGFALCVVAWLFSWIQAGLFVVQERMSDV